MNEPEGLQFTASASPPMPEEKRRWGIRWAIFAYLGFWTIQAVASFLAGVGYGVFRLIDGRPWPSKPGDFPPELWGAASIAGQLLILLFVVLLIRFAHDLDLRSAVRWVGKRKLLPLAAAGIGSLVMFFNITLLFLKPPSEGMNIPLMDMTATPGGLVTFGFMAVFVAPFVEEFLFRGYIFEPFERRWGGRWAVVATTGLFMLPHMLQLGDYWQGALLIGVLGAVNGVLRAYTGGIRAGVICHFVYNALLVLFEVLTRFVS